MSTPVQTPLYTLHVEHGASLVPFAGYHLPLHYADGILQEHLHTRAAASLFDVSHMGQILLRGADAARALETLTPADVIGLGVGRPRYALLTDTGGGILDDFMVARLHDDPAGQPRLLLVVNAARKQADLAHLRTHLTDACAIESLADRALLALQGPRAEAAIALSAPSAPSEAPAALRFLQTVETSLAGIDCIISRSGYTGEDGFELSVSADDAEALARRLLAGDDVKPAGLGARDSLRLEAGLCLHGNDIDVSTTPIEAGLAWAVARCRRAGGKRAGGFPGADTIQQQLDRGVQRRRIGLRPDGRAPVRAGAELCDADGHVVGRVTSGGYGPSVGAPVAMGYLNSGHELGVPLTANVRGRALAATPVVLPFITPRYLR